jgi:hypothetical protein
MKTTTTYGISYPESPDHTRTWEYWQEVATKVDSLLAGRWGMLTLANDLRIGDPAQTTDNMLRITKVSSGIALETRHRVFPTGGGGGQGTCATTEIFEAGAEVAQLIYRRDGYLNLKSGGAAGTVRPVPFAMAAGFINVSVSNVSQGTGDWTFPVGRFTVAPLVIASSTNSIWMVGCQAVDTTKATIYARSYNNTNGGVGGQVGVHLWAFQMTPTANQG